MVQNNKELKPYGEAKGPDLGQNPTNSVLALFPGGITPRPGADHLLERHQADQGAAHLAGREPVSGWIAIILYILIAPAFWAYLQVSLDRIWEQKPNRCPGTTPPAAERDEMPPRLNEAETARPRKERRISTPLRGAPRFSEPGVGAQSLADRQSGIQTRRSGIASFASSGSWG